MRFKRIRAAFSGLLLMTGFYQLEVIEWLRWTRLLEDWSSPFGWFWLPMWLARDVMYGLIFIAWVLLLPELLDKER